MTDTQLELKTGQLIDKPEEKPIDLKSFSFYMQDILTLGVPLTLSAMTVSIQALTAVYFAGKLGDVALLDAISLGGSWCSIFGFSLIFGAAGAVNTLVSQSFGKKDYKSCGLVFNRALLIVSLVAIPCSIFMLFSGHIFSWVGINPVVADYTVNIIVTLIPSLFMNVPAMILDKFLNAQRIVKPQLVMQVINMLLYPLYCYIFMFALGMGYLGSSVARFVASFVFTAGLATYVKVSKCCELTLVAPSFKELFKGWDEYFSIAGPATTMVCLEWWGFEVVNLMCGRLGVVELATNTISMNFMAFEYVICAGLGNATGTFVGNSLGEKNAHNAKAYSLVGATGTLLVVTFLGGIVILCRNFFASLFTTDPDVVRMLQTVFFLVALNELFDGTQGTLANILIGMGRQARASMINLFAYYALMIPIALLAAFKLGLGIYGIWIAYLSAGLFVCVGFSLLIYKENWTALVLEVEARGKEDSPAAGI